MNTFSGAFNRLRCIDETVGKTTYKRTKTHAVLVLFIAIDFILFSSAKAYDFL